MAPIPQLTSLRLHTKRFIFTLLDEILPLIVSVRCAMTETHDG
jgi:hypothetical protein